MKIHQIRNATICIDYGDVRLLVDPMLMKPHVLPSLRLFKHRGRNPVVPLPKNTPKLLASATHGLITHFQKGHFDHLDRTALKWLRERKLPVFCTTHDAPVLARKGVRTIPLRRDHTRAQGFFDGSIQVIPCRHGRGLVGLLMEHGSGYFIQKPGAPSLLVTGDTILTPELRDFVGTYQPNVIVAPAGGAYFDIGGKIIMDASDMVALARLTPGTIIAIHIGAISHCPVTHADVAEAAQNAGLQDRIIAPADGTTLTFD